LKCVDHHIADDPLPRVAEQFCDIDGDRGDTLIVIDERCGVVTVK